MTTPPLRNVLERLLQWDHFDAAGDGAFWRREIAAALAAPLPEPEPPLPVALVHRFDDGTVKFQSIKAELLASGSHWLYTAPIAAAQGEPRPAAALIVAPPVAAAAPLPQPPELPCSRLGSTPDGQRPWIADQNVVAIGEKVWRNGTPHPHDLIRLSDALRDHFYALGGTESDLTARPAISTNAMLDALNQAMDEQSIYGAHTRAELRANFIKFLGDETERSGSAVQRPVPTPSVEEMVLVPRRLMWQAFNALDEVDYENDPPKRILDVMTELRAAKNAAVPPEALRSDEQKPVAWIPAYRLPIDDQSTGKLFATKPSGELGDCCIPLYLGAAPQAPETKPEK